MNKIIYLIILVILIGGGFYFWQNRYDYFFQGSEPYRTYEETENEEEEVSDGLVGEDSSDQNENNNKDQLENNDVSDDMTTVSGNEELLDILENHCPNRCESQKGSSDYDYCMEICGLSGNSEDEERSSDCEEIASGFEKDVCYKNQAIREKKSEICDNIADGLLKDNCKDRVIEELFN